MAYTQRQIMLSFAYVAYTDQLLTTGTPSLDAQIQADVENNISANPSGPTPIPPVAGQWSVVWGPVSYTVPGAMYQDNMMYVVQLNQPAATPNTPAPAPQYAVAVRGTNGADLLDWLMEDLDIAQMIPWSPGSSISGTAGNISEATSVGLAALLNMTDPTSETTLLQFLANEMTLLTNGINSNPPTMSGPASICFTGHSLGATLASTLALYVLDNQSTWDPSSNAIVTTINFAGPTAGDQDFATYFDQQFTYTGTSPLSYWVSPTDNDGSYSYADCVRTSYDIVPLLWNTTSMGTIEDIYKQPDPIHDILAPPGTKEVIDFIIDNVIQNNSYTQVQSAQNTLAGSFVYKSDLPKLGSTSHWVVEAEYQHHCSYPNALNVPQILEVFPFPPTS
ncbi:MAG: hypothetical protein WAM82_27530 [Thermoanaerobaculia bacterium]